MASLGAVSCLWLRLVATPPDLKTILEELLDHGLVQAQFLQGNLVGWLSKGTQIQQLGLTLARGVETAYPLQLSSI